MTVSDHKGFHTSSHKNRGTLKTDIEPDYPSGSELVSLVREQLRAAFFLEAERAKQTPTILPPLQRVNVTLRTSGVLRGSMSGIGDTFHEQLHHAVERAAGDTRFVGPLVAADLEALTIEVWLQIDSEVIPLDARSGVAPFAAGIEGLEVECDGTFAYYKPSVALTTGFASLQDAFSALCKKAGLAKDRWLEKSCDLRRSTWIHYAGVLHGTLQLTGLRSIRPLDAEAMRWWIESGAEYLKSNQLADGSITYLYEPFSNSALREKTNSVRASGCAYALAIATSFREVALSQDVWRCAQRAIQSIAIRAVELSGGGLYIPEQESAGASGKLGSTALLLVAMLQPSMQLQFQEPAALLMRAVRRAQGEDGSFTCGYPLSDTAPGSSVNYFPGQALLALVLSAAQGNEQSRTQLRRGFVPYRDHFRHAPSSAFIGWQADVWSRAALLEGNEEYSDFVFEQIDWLLRFQVGAEAGDLFAGGFSLDRQKPNASSVVHAEALARGAALAERLGDARAEHYKASLLSALGFCSNLRLDTDQALFFPHPQRAIGGVIRNPSHFEVRSDLVQHLITLAIATLEVPRFLQTSHEEGGLLMGTPVEV